MNRIWNKGQKLSEDHKNKISQKMKQLYKKGKLQLPDNKGKRPWNVGIHRTEEEKQKISLAKKGKPAWNKNKSWPEKIKKKISLSKKGSIPWNKGKARTEEEIQKMREGAKRMWERRRKLSSKTSL